MKKDRNYMPYPIYPMNQNYNPMGFSYPNQMGYPGGSQMDEMIQNLQGQINMLDKRVSNLENHMSKDYNKYSDSNYHIM